MATSPARYVQQQRSAGRAASQHGGWIECQIPVDFAAGLVLLRQRCDRPVASQAPHELCRRGLCRQLGVATATKSPRVLSYITSKDATLPKVDIKLITISAAWIPFERFWMDPPKDQPLSEYVSPFVAALAAWQGTRLHRAIRPQLGSSVQGHQHGRRTTTSCRCPSAGTCPRFLGHMLTCSGAIPTSATGKG